MGACIYTPGEKNAYIPIHHTDLADNLLPNQLTEEDIKEQFSRLKDTKIIMHNGKFDYEVIYCTCDLELDCYWDTMIAARLLNENEEANLKKQYISKIDPSIEKYSIDHLFIVPYNYVDPELFALYAATDSFMTHELYLWQVNEFKKDFNSKIYNLFMEVEMPIMFISAKMELTGVCIDKEYANRLSIKYHNKVDKINKQIEVELNNLQPQINAWRRTQEANYKPLKKGFIIKAGKIVKEKTNEIYNIDDKECYAKSKSEQLSNPPETTSPTQLAILIYDVLKTPVIDNSSPRGTGAEILEQLKDIPICTLINEQKTVLKLLDAFIDTLPNLVSIRDGRLHSNFNQLGTDTGRFVSKKPNLQQVPSRNNEIRMLFKATNGYTFVGADYSQQEPRLMTFLSQDPKMLQAYQEDKDLYAIMGTGVWYNNYWDNMEHNEDGSSNVEGKKRRSLCKKLLLGIMYSMGPATTASNMNITKEEAEDIIDRFYKGFPKVKKFIEDNQEFVSKHGYVEDAWGRRRRLPDATLPERTYKKKNSSNFNPLLNSNSNYISDNDRKLFLTYEKRLKEAKSFKERDAINKDAAKNGIEIINNSGFISRAKRQCTNARIQGSAATMTKKAMILIDRDEELRSYGFRLLIGVHDELIGECLVEYANKCAERLSYLMKSAVADTIHNVPFKCDAEVEPSWYWNTYSHTIQKEYKDLLSKYSEIEAFDKLKEEHIELLENQLKEALNNNDKK